MYVNRPEKFLPEPGTWSSLSDLLCWRAGHQEGILAYTFLRDGASSAQTITYGELGRRAHTIARSLHRRHLSGERILLVYPPGLDFLPAFFGCLLTGVVAVPIPSPAPHRWQRHLTKFRAICDDAAPAAILTTAAIRDTRPSDVTEFSDLVWLTLEQEADGSYDTEDWTPFAAGIDTLAYLQYTSGSTSAPKGVMVSHGNVLDNCRALNVSCQIDPESRFVSWLPHFHDMGLVYGIILPLCHAIPSYLMSPMAFIQRPSRWLEAISDFKATHSAAPNFAYDLCVEKTTPEDRLRWDLSQWDVALNGAEPVQSGTIQRFADAFASSGFRPSTFCPGYGLAEATLKVTLVQKRDPVRTCTVDASELEQRRVRDTSSDSPNAKTLVGCGHTTPDIEVAIVDAVLGTRCAPEIVGEIWVSSPSNALGYWNRPEETRQTFHAHLADSPGKDYLRTGDLGFLKGEELYVTGRIKDLIIIRGANYYPQDFEMAVHASHPALRQMHGMAFSVTSDDDEHLVLVHEVSRHDKHAELAPIFASIRAAISQEFALPVQTVVLVTAGSLPKTSSGKSQRRLCREMFLSGTLDLLGESTLSTLSSSDAPDLLTQGSLWMEDPKQRRVLLETHLCDRIAVSLQAMPSEISPQQPINMLGIDSMLAAQMANDLQDSLGISLSVSMFLGEQTLSEIATEMLTKIAKQENSPAELDAPFVAEDALSFGQKALWSIHQRAPNSAAYNIAGAFRIQPQLEVAALQSALQTLVERHPSLRSTFPMQHGEPRRNIVTSVMPALFVVDASAWNDLRVRQYLQEMASAPFDLEAGPLFRIHLLQRSSGESILIFSLHHIISDFWSMTILIREVFLHYQAELQNRDNTLPALPAQFQDYVHWQQQQVSGPRGEADSRYWRNQLAGQLPALDLPTDYPRPASPTYRGALYPFQIDQETTQKLKSLGRTYGTTPFMTLLAGFLALLFRYTGQEDLLVGVPTSGRDRLDWSQVIGYFVNPVVIRADLSGDLSFADLLQGVRKTVLEALDHQVYAFPLLVDRLQPKRDPSRSPVFQTMFVWQSAASEDIPPALALGADGVTFMLGDLTLESIALEGESAQFDLSLSMGEIGEEFGASFKYSTDLFHSATIARMCEHLHTLLERVADRPEILLSEIPLHAEMDAAHEPQEGTLFL